MSLSKNVSQTPVESIYRLLGMPASTSQSTAQAFLRQIGSVIKTILVIPGRQLELQYTRYPLPGKHDPDQPTLHESHAYLIVRSGSKEDHLRHLSMLSVLEDFSRYQAVDEIPVLVSANRLVNVSLDSDGSGGKHIGFDEVRDTLGARLPWQMNLVLDSGFQEARDHLMARTRLRRWAGLAGFKGSVKPYEKSLFSATESSALVRSSLTFKTWGDSDAAARRNESHIQSCLSNSQVASICEVGAIDLDQCLALLPVTQPGSPWMDCERAVNFVTPGAEIFRYEPHSNLQAVNIELVVDPTQKDSSGYRSAITQALWSNPEGVGRMVTVSINRKRSAYLPGDLPEGTSEGLVAIDLARDDQAVNVVECPLGTRHGTSRHSNNLACLLDYTCGDLLPRDKCWWVANALIKLAYEHYSQRHRPKAYYYGVDLQVDSAIDLLGRGVPETWWEASEELMLLGFPEESHRAHRLAVPNVSNLVEFIRNGAISSSWVSAECALQIADRLGGVIEACPAIGSPSNFKISHMEAVTLDIDTSVRVEGLSRKAVFDVQWLFARVMATEGLFDDAFTDFSHHYETHRQRLLMSRGKVRQITYQDMEQVLVSEGLTYTSFHCDLREAKKHAVSLTVCTSQLNEPISRFDSYFLTYAVFDLWNLDQNNREWLGNMGVYPARGEMYKRVEQSGFLFHARISAKSWLVTQFLRLPKAGLGKKV